MSASSSLSPAAIRRFSATLALAVTATLGPQAAAQPSPDASPAPAAAEDEPFTDEQRVTAVDVMIELESSAFRRWRKGRLQAEAFTVRSDGVTRRVVGLEKPGAESPTRQVVVLDAAGSATRTLRWGAGLLAERADQLVALGPVEILISTPEIQQVLPPTRDLEAVKERLSQLALTVTGDDRLASMRQDAAGAENPSKDAALRARCAEREAALRSHDALLRALTEAERDADRRALYWLTGGFATELHRAYGLEPPSPDNARAAGGLELRSRDLSAESLALGETLAAYGWTTLALTPPPPDPLRGKGPGLRLGKWRFVGPAATYEAERDPEKAEAFIVLGDAHRRAGDAQRAADSYESAFYHFWGDPRTAERQAHALASLADQLDALGRGQEARRARGMARQLDEKFGGAGLETSPDAGAGSPIEPFRADIETLQALALESAGRRIASAEELDSALESLSRRVRLTYQVGGAPTGELVPLEVRSQDDGAPQRAPRRARSGTPERLETARARWALSGQAEEVGPGGGGALDLQASLSGDGALVVEARYRGPARSGRLTVAAGGGETCTRVGHLTWRGSPPPSVLVTLREPAAALLWSDFETAAWGAVRRRTGL